MKNNYSLLNKGDENSNFYSSESKSGIQKTKKISFILKDNFRKYRRNNSLILDSRHKTDLKKVSKKNNNLYKINHNSFINDIVKLSPKLKLQYDIELYEKKQRYSLLKKDELIDEKKYNGKYFIKKNYKTSYSYKICFNQRNKNNLFISNQKSISYGKFRPSPIKENILININKNNTDIQMIKKDNKNLRPKSSTKSNTINTNLSKPFSGIIIENNNNNKIKENKLYFKNKSIRLKCQISKTFEKAHNASINLNKDINESKNYDKLNKLVEKTKKYKKNKILKYKNINKNKRIKDNKDNLYKYLDIEKNVENRIIKSYKYYDKIGKNIIKQAMEQEKNKEHFLNKNENSKNIILNSRFLIKKLGKELSILGANILATKKKYKGNNAIEPNNEVKFLHKLIKENMLSNLNDDQYFEEVIKRKNLNESMSSKIKKRILSLQQKSLSIKNKIRESDYSYL